MHHFKEKIAIVGGSNSVLKESYVNLLHVAHTTKPLHITNKAIGMTNSLYSLLQIQKYDLLQTNDSLIHEYFVNDNNHYFQGLNSPERVKKNLLTLIHACIETKKKLLIIMIYNRADQLAGKYSQSPIFTIYTDLIKQYNIPFIDMFNVLYRKALGKWVQYYRDDTHLNLGGMVILKDEILKKLPTLGPLTLGPLTLGTQTLPDIYDQLRVVQLVDTASNMFQNKYSIKTLQNSLVNIQYLVVTDSITLNFDKPTELLAVEYVCDQRSGYIDISANNTRNCIQKNTLKAEKLVLLENKPMVAVITFNTHTFPPATTYTISMIQAKDLHPSHYDREKNTYDTLKLRMTNFKIASLLVTNGATLHQQR